LDAEDIRKHWTDWATTYGADLRATTRTPTAKALELNALARRLNGILGDGSAAVLEVGCGNGINCVELAKQFGQASFDGVDFIPEMVSAAGDNAAAAGVGDRLRFFQGDATDLGATAALREVYDVVFTDRCLINLNTTAMQVEAIAGIAKRIRPGGHLLMIENSLVSYGEQNRCREQLGLQARTPATFNHFFDEGVIVGSLPDAGLKLVEVEDFSSLHDLLLYVLVPATNGGTVEYDHPLVQAATQLSLGMPGNAFGGFGQNRLFVCQKTG